MTYQLQWALTIIAGCCATGTLIGIAWAAIREAKRRG